MLSSSLIFLVLALIAGVFSFSGIVVASTGITKFLFFIFAALFVITILSALLKKYNKSIHNIINNDNKGDL